LGPLPSLPAEVRVKPPITPGMAGLILLPNAPAPEAPPEEPAAPPDPAFVSQVDGAMAELGKHADRYGVIVAFRSDLAGFAQVHAALRRADCQWFGIDLDPPAVLRDRWSEDEIFSQVGPLIRHVRGRDANVGAERRIKHAVIGRGNTDWSQLVSNLDAAGYSGWVTIDPTELTDRAGAATAGLGYLRGIVGAPSPSRAL
jgi:sugar phosphate isomerase/epimerase